VGENPLCKQVTSTAFEEPIRIREILTVEGKRTRIDLEFEI
jgi:hypothetical protein